MKLGKHVSIAGGIDKAFKRAKDIGCNCLQIFSKNPRGWKGRNIPEAEINRVKNSLTKMKMNPLVVHNTYLINLATPDEELLEKSVNGMIDDYTRAGKIDASYMVVHPGSHKGEGLNFGISRIINCLNFIFDNVKNDCIILLENVAGAGNNIGANFQEINKIISDIEAKERIGFCLDTCHAHAAGYDLSQKRGLEDMLQEMEQDLGLNHLKLIHINDSKHKTGLNKDEHAHIGEGYIGLDGFENIVNHPDLKNLPFILETPQFDGKDKDVQIILSLRKTGE